MKSAKTLGMVALAFVLGLTACVSRPLTTSVLPTPVSIIPTAISKPTSTWTPTVIPSPIPTDTPKVTPTTKPTATLCPTPTPGGPVSQIVFSAVPCTADPDGCELHELSVANIYLINSDGTGLRQLVAGGNLLDGLSLSPDGKKIAFIDAREDVQFSLFRSHVYVWDISTGKIQSLMSELPDESSPQSPQWFPDSSRLAYVSSLVDNRGTTLGDSPTNLYTIRADGTERTRVIERPSRSHIQSVAISPDGLRVVFIGREFGPPEQVGAYVVDADGTNLRELMSISSPGNQPELFWSPDSSEIFILDHSVNNPSSFVVRADGPTPPTKVAQVPGYLTGYRWAVNSVIEVTVCGRNVGTSIWVMRDNSNDLRKLGDFPGECLQASDRWSSDGTRVAFSKHAYHPRLFGLYILDINSGCEYQILGEYYLVDLFWLPTDVIIP